MLRCNIGDDGAKIIADFVKTNTTITNLSIEIIFYITLFLNNIFIKINNNFGIEGCKAIVDAFKANTTITGVSLHCIHLDNTYIHSL